MEIAFSLLRTYFRLKPAKPLKKAEKYNIKNKIDTSDFVNYGHSICFFCAVTIEHKKYRKPKWLIL